LDRPDEKPKPSAWAGIVVGAGTGARIEGFVEIAAGFTFLFETKDPK
jgi:hypothetical protein